MKGVFVILMILLAGDLLAQISEVGIDQGRSTNNRNARLKELGPITLPFWDDFSTSRQQVDTSWWDPESQVQVIAKPGIGINPPTINVATFDGVDAAGNPYSDTKTDGYVDSLISRRIDLTQVPQNLRNSVFLSFSYQAKGLGDQPEELDSLTLYMRRSDSTWRKVWPLPDDPYPSDPTRFYEEFIQVADPIFYHEGFQFMFRAIGRQNGWFDNWHVDYVYMDKRRALGDNSYLDRAFTAAPSSILGDYTALPIKDYMIRISEGPLFTPSETKLRNLEDDFQPVEYSATLKDTFTSQILDTLLFEEPLLMFPNDLQTVTSSIPDGSNFPSDSMYLEIKYWVNSGDKNLIDSISNGFLDTAFYDHINLRVNDTVRSYVSVNDHYAFDDGTAERGAGINQRFGRLAYQFITKTPQVLDRIDAYWPNTDRNQAGSPIEIFVLRDLEETEESTQSVISTAVQHTGINEFVTYNINPPVMVADTFYIGFRHLDTDERWISIGLDKNTETGSRMYSNITGIWVQNQSVSGSLMLRPYFTDDPITSITQEGLIETASIYPNPSRGSFNIKGQVQNLRVFDVRGQAIPFYQEQTDTGVKVRLDVPGPTIVIVQFRDKYRVNAKKVIIRPD